MPPSPRFLIDWRWLVIGIVVLVLLIGLIIIALIKIILTCQDRIEYAQFKKEVESAQKQGVSVVYRVILL